MKKLTKRQIILLHSQLIEATGGSTGIRDEGLLDSALNMPFQTYLGVDMFPSLESKAARLGYGLVKNLEYTQEDLYTIILEIASSEKNYNELLQWIINHE